MLDNYNLTMLTDFYEVTMANGYFQSDIRNHEAVFDMFFRRRYRLSPQQEFLLGGISGVSPELQIHLRRVGGTGRNTNLPA